jgi:hypothetical protein
LRRQGEERITLSYHRSRRTLGETQNEQTIALPHPLIGEVAKAQEAWRSNGNTRRLWNAAATLWTGHDENDWFGWLDIVENELRDLEPLQEFARKLRGENFTDALVGANSTLGSWLKAHFARLKDGDYFALVAYLDGAEARMQPLQDLRVAVRDKRHVATCLQFGPRFLHSTGQAYRGGRTPACFSRLRRSQLPISTFRAARRASA